MFLLLFFSLNFTYTTLNYIKRSIGRIFKDMNYVRFSWRAYFIFNFQIFTKLTSFLFRGNVRKHKATCKFLLRSTLTASLSRIYQTLLTMYWHCDVIDLPIYLGTKKWLNVAFSQRNGRSIPFSTANEKFNCMTMQRPQREWRGIRRNLRREQSHDI